MQRRHGLIEFEVMLSLPALGNTCTDHCGALFLTRKRLGVVQGGRLTNNG